MNPEDNIKNEKMILKSPKLFRVVFFVWLFMAFLTIIYNALFYSGNLRFIYPKSDAVPGPTIQKTEQTSNQNKQSTDPSTDPYRNDLFMKEAFLVPGGLSVYARFYGETNRSCLDSSCTQTKMDCVKWNKSKTLCYQEMPIAVSQNAKRYRIYCELVIVNQDAVGVTASFNANYLTKDNKTNPVDKLSYRIETGSGYAFLWQYDVDAGNIGKCNYTNLQVAR